eukprot:scaffold42023_cov21-Tisochrysis_lutea.AAC.1
MRGCVQPPRHEAGTLCESAAQQPHATCALVSPMLHVYSFFRMLNVHSKLQPLELRQASSVSAGCKGVPKTTG